jgi:hypothetical protein
VLEQVSVLAEACCDKLRIVSALPVEGDPSGGDRMPDGSVIVEARRPDFGTALMTGFAHFVLTKEFDVAPLRKRELEKFLSTAFVESRKDGRAIDPAATEKFLSWLERKTGFKGHKWAILEAYVMERLELVEEDLAGAPSAKDVDPLLVESMLLAK